MSTIDGEKTYKELQSEIEKPFGNKSLELLAVEDIKPLVSYQDQSKNKSQKPLTVEDIEPIIFDYNPLDNAYTGKEKSPLIYNNDYLGRSKYDKKVYTEDDINLLEYNPDELRAREQGGISKLLSGISKGAVLAGTTFLDGTAGLIYGIGQGIAEQRLSALFDNDFSNALQNLNKSMETVLPNYRTIEEIEGPWYKNMDTMNFWSDTVLKNLGFTVGAGYSAATWLKGLKAIKAVKSGVVASQIGSTLMGINEGRIEANTAKREFIESQNMQLENAYRSRYEEILDMNISDKDKTSLIEDLNRNAEALRRDVEDRGDKMGMTVLIANSITLPFTDWWQFGKLFARGFATHAGIKAASKAASKKLETSILEEGAKKLASEKMITKIGNSYLPKTITKGKSIARGLSKGLSEGFEEMLQQFYQSSAGEIFSADSPDAYYESLINEDSKLKTQDVLSGLTKGFTESFGDGSQWEQFAVGFITGAIGVPTFGKVNNSDVNTVIGKGKRIGLSGGIWGQINSDRESNDINTKTAEVMNKYMKKIEGINSYFVQNESFTNAMDGWAEAKNAFEYQNVSDNDDFAGFAAFARAGRLNDLKEIINQDFENISDEELHKIAMYTTKDIQMNEDSTISTKDKDGNTLTGIWVDTDGTLMSETEEGRKKMREELIKKRDKLLTSIDLYTQSVETVRGISNNSFTDEQVNELAWLAWKPKLFTERYLSIKDEFKEDISNSMNILTELISSSEPTKYRDIVINSWQRRLDNIQQDVVSYKNKLDYLKKREKQLKEQIQQEENSEKKDNLEKKLLDISQRQDAIFNKYQLAKTAFKESKSQFSLYKKSAETEEEIQQDKILSEEHESFIKSMQHLYNFFELVSESKSPLELSSRLKVHQKILDAIDTEDFKEFMNSRMGMDSMTIDRLITAMNDIVKIADATESFSKRFEEFKKNPLNIKDKHSAINKVKDKINSVRKDIKNEKVVKDSNVSDIVKAVNIGDVDLEELESAINSSKNTEKTPENREKLQTVKTLINNKEILSKKIENSEINEQIKNDAQSLLNASLNVSNSNNEFRDLNSAAYNDLDNLDLEEELNNGEEITEEQLSERLLKAKTLLSQCWDEFDDAFADLDNENIQSNEDLNNAYEEALNKVESEQNETTGHDAVTKIPSVNQEEKQYKKNIEIEIKQETEKQKDNPFSIETLSKQLEKNLDIILDEYSKPILKYFINDIFRYVEMSIPVDKIMTEIQYQNMEYQAICKIKESQNEDIPSSNIIQDVNTKISEFIEYVEKNKDKIFKQESTETVQYTAINEEEQFSQDSTIPFTPNINKEFIGNIGKKDIQKSINNDNDNKLNNTTVTVGKKKILNYWKPTTTYMPMNAVGRTAPFYSNEFLESTNYSPEKKERIKKIGQYLEEHGVFTRIDKGQIETGTKVYFITDPVFNESIGGDPVIFMAVKKHTNSLEEGINNNLHEYYDIIGDVMSIEDIDNLKSKSEQLYLRDFVENFNKEYQASQTTDSNKYYVSNQTSTIRYILTGKVPYNNGKRYTLNTVYSVDEQNTSFILGVAMEDGNMSDIKTTFSEENDDLKQYIKSPLNAKAGQPYLIIPTGDPKGPNRYVTVPFSMESYNPSIHKDTVMHKAIVEIVQKLITGNKDIAKSLCLQLMDLLSARFHVYYKDGDLQITIGSKADNTFKEIFNSKLETPKILNNLNPDNINYLTDTIIKNLNGIPFSVSIKYINSTYNNMDYNKMIGEIAEVDINPGDTRTISNWFVINPIGKDGEVQASKPTNLKYNPNAVSNKPIIFTTEEDSNIEVEVDLNKRLVTVGGKILSDTDMNKYLYMARAIGIQNGYTIPYLTEWGIYNPSTNTFDKIENSNINNIPNNKDSNVNTITNTVENNNETDQLKPDKNEEEIIEQNQKQVEKNLINSVDLNYHKTAKTILNSMTATQKEGLFKYTFAADILTQLCIAYNPRNKIIDFKKIASFSNVKNIDELIEKLTGSSGKFRLVTADSKPTDLNKELKWLESVLPQLSTKERLQLVEGLTGFNGDMEAFGMFKDSIIYLNTNNLGRGTLYHEAFHAVFDTLLTDLERTKIYTLAKKTWGNLPAISLEEHLAEDFRKYTEYEEYSDKLFARFWRRLYHIIKNLFGKDKELNKLYYDINQAKYRSRSINSLENETQKIEQIQKEMEQIKKEAIADERIKLKADGSFDYALAPNGKKSNLNERQWLQVRTKSFKNWFGDWENDSENASKVIDENSEPLVVYHESPNKFDTFDFTKKRYTVHNGNGAWFSTIDKNGNGYGENIYPVFLNIRNLGKTKWETVKNLSLKELRIIETELLNNTQYDGIKIETFDKNGQEIQYAVTKSPNQIKSATGNNGEFSPENNNMYDDHVNEIQSNTKLYRRELLKLLDFDKLSPEDQQYVLNNNISKEKYNEMSLIEKEFLINYCK